MTTHGFRRTATTIALAGAAALTAPRPTFGQPRWPVMGPIPHEGGTRFRVWAPHADAVGIAGSFNDWSPTATPMTREPGGLWFADVPDARPGDRFRYVIKNGREIVTRRDPYSRLVTSSNYERGLTVIYDPEAFEWNDEGFQRPAVEDLVIYEMHIGTFNDPNPDGCGTFADAIARLDHVAALGATAVEVLPVCEFLGQYSGGYDPADLFAVENRGYGGPDGFKAFVEECHARDLAVIVDVVYNHWGPWDLTTYRFDGWWSSNFPGGIYFYDAARIDSPWGPRPDYRRARVRQYIADNLRMWIDECHVDGFRWDATAAIYRVDGAFGEELPEGWTLLQQCNDALDRFYPGVISIAEDIWTGDPVTAPTSQGGAGFDAQWHFLQAHLREELIRANGGNPNLRSVRYAMRANYNGDPWQRVVFTESHNETCCGDDRLTVEIDPDDPDSWAARKLSTLGASLMFTTPGIPMILQGQEFLDHTPFDERRPIDWSQLDRHPGVFRLYHDLIALRRNLDGTTAGLKGANLNVHHLNDAANVMAYHRWDAGGPGDDVVVIANFSDQPIDDYRVGFPRAGVWRVRFNGDWTQYGPDYSNQGPLEVNANGSPRDGLPVSAALTLPPYSVLILSQDR